MQARIADRSIAIAEATDANLLDRIARGDFPAFQLFHQRHVRRVAGYARQLSRDAALAEDIVQEVFLTVWTRATTFRPERGAAAGWLYTLTRNRLIDHWRKAESSSETRSLDDVHLSGENGDRELALAVRQALAILDTGPRRAIEMAYYGGLSYQEAARRLDLPEGTLKSRIRAGLRALRGLLENGAGSYSAACS